MNKLKKELIETVVYRHTISYNGLDTYWVILINGRLYSPSCGTCFFESRDKAWKCWYNQTNWGIKSSYRRDYAHQQGYKSSWDYKGTYPMTDRQVWEDFKNQLYEEYDFKIIQWKYAKRDVCGEIGA